MSRLSRTRPHSLFSPVLPNNTEGVAKWHTEVLRDQDNSAIMPCYVREHRNIRAPVVVLTLSA